MSSHHSSPSFSDGGEEAKRNRSPPPLRSFAATWRGKEDLGKAAGGQCGRSPAQKGPTSACTGFPRPRPPRRSKPPRLRGRKHLPNPRSGCGLPHPRGTTDPPVTQPGRRERPAPLPAEGPTATPHPAGRPAERAASSPPSAYIRRAGGSGSVAATIRAAPRLPASSPCWARGRRAGSGRCRDPDPDRDRDPWPRALPHAGPDPQRCRTALSPPPETQGMLGAGFPFSQLHPAVPYTPR